MIATGNIDNGTNGRVFNEMIQQRTRQRSTGMQTTEKKRRRTGVECLKEQIFEIGGTDHDGRCRAVLLIVDEIFLIFDEQFLPSHATMRGCLARFNAEYIALIIMGELHAQIATATTIVNDLNKGSTTSEARVAVAGIPSRYRPCSQYDRWLARECPPRVLSSHS